MDNLKILHITPWLKSERTPLIAPFVLDLVRSLQPFAYNEILHIEIDETKTGIFPRIKFEQEKNGTININRVRFINFPNKWRVYELLCYYYINRFLTNNYKRFDVVNFYIAYPNATFIKKFIRKFPQILFTIYEVWTAYRNGFNLPKTSPGRKRIENIFSENPNLFVISTAQGEDIQSFCSQPVKFEVVPGIVDTSIYKFNSQIATNEYQISSINWWSAMKNGDVLIRAFKLVSQKLPHSRLVLGGGGYLLNSMKSLATELAIDHKIDFTGPLTKNQVAEILTNSHVYCQSSIYETFSVICIDALCSGTPVIATNIGGMKDFINPGNGLLVNSMEPSDWANAILKLIENLKTYDTKTNSEIIKEKYSPEKVGELFYEKIQKLRGH